MNAGYHGIYYSSRPLQGGYGILVSVWFRGEWLETDMNTTVWPTQKVALERARGAAEAASAREGLPIWCALNKVGVHFAVELI